MLSSLCNNSSYKNHECPGVIFEKKGSGCVFKMSGNLIHLFQNSTKPKIECHGGREMMRPQLILRKLDTPIIVPLLAQ